MPKKPPQRQLAKRNFIGLIIVLLVAGSATLGYVMTRPAQQARVIDPGAPLPKPLGHVMGSDSAPVEITMFGDFECPGCGQFATVTEPDVRARIVNTGLARFRFLDFPLTVHKNTLTAHNAASCAGAQGKFWEMHDRIYLEQPNWSDLVQGKDSKDPVKAMRGYASALGIDMARYDACMTNGDFQLQIRANEQEGERLGVNGTPTFFIGRRMLGPGSPPYDLLKATVDSAIADAKAAAKSAPATKAVPANKPTTKKP